MASLSIWNSRLKRESDLDQKIILFTYFFLPSLTGFSILSESSLLILLPSQLSPYFSTPISVCAKHRKTALMLFTIFQGHSRSLILALTESQCDLLQSSIKNLYIYHTDYQIITRFLCRLSLSWWGYRYWTRYVGETPKGTIAKYGTEEDRDSGLLCTRRLCGFIFSRYWVMNCQ